MGATVSRPQPEAFAGHSFGVLNGISVAPRYVAADLAVTEWRCHEAAHSVSGEKHQPWHVVGFVHSGSFRLRCRRGQGVADPAAVVLFRPGEPYETAHTDRCGDRGSAIAISPALAATLERDLSAPGERDLWRSPLRPLAAACLARQLEVLRHLTAGGETETAIEEALLGILSLLLSPAGAGTAPGPTHGRERVAAAQEILERRFQQPVGIAELAREVGLSPFHLCREFRRHTGWTIHRYLTHLRIVASLERLASTPRESLLDLALDLGFDGHSHFSAVFRRHVGRTPSAFRRLAS